MYRSSRDAPGFRAGSRFNLYRVMFLERLFLAEDFVSPVNFEVQLDVFVQLLLQVAKPLRRRRAAS